MFFISTCAIAFLMLLTTGCTSHMAVMQQDKYESSIAFNEMRAEIADLKHSLSNAQVEIRILEEQVQNQEASLKRNKIPSTDSKVPLLETRLVSLEKMQEKIQFDLKQLSSHANQTGTSIQQYAHKIAELENLLVQQGKVIRDLGDLKTSLKSLSYSLAKEEASSLTYKVKAGDSLEKIARNHQISLESLKKANNLSQNKILIGQELIIPSAP